MYERPASWAQEQGPSPGDSPPLPAPERVARLPVDDTVAEPDTGHSFAWTGLISASTYTPSYLRKTPTDYHLFLNVSKLLSFPRLCNSRANPTEMYIVLLDGPRTEPHWTQSQAEVRACSWKRASLSRKGLSPAGCPEVEAETPPHPLYVHACARVCMRVCAQANRGSGE